MIGSYAVHDAVLVQSAGKDKWGTPLTPIEIPLKVFIEYGTFIVFTVAGEEVMCNAVIHMEDINISHEDNLFFDGEMHTIKKIKRPGTLDHESLEVYVI